MQEKHLPEESIRDQTLRRFRSESNTLLSSKKKKFSTGLVIINLAIIIVLYIFYVGQKPEKSYLTTSFNYRDTAFRFSMSKVKNSGDYIFYLSTRAAGKVPVTLRLTGGMADLVVLCGPDVIMSEPFGRDVSTLTLMPNEPDIRKQVIDPHEFFLFSQSHPDRMVVPANSLFQFRKPYLPLTAEIRIHTDQPVSTAINFMYEVEQ
jgi:hypothetical protein